MKTCFPYHANSHLLARHLDDFSRVFVAHFDHLKLSVEVACSTGTLRQILFYQVRKFFSVTVQLCNRSIRSGEFEDMRADAIKPVWQSNKLKRKKRNSE